MNGAIREWFRERRVDELVLVNERESRELAAHDGDVKVIAASRAVDDLDDAGLRKGVPQQSLEQLHARRLAACADTRLSHEVR